MQQRVGKLRTSFDKTFNLFRLKGKELQQIENKLTSWAEIESWETRRKQLGEKCLLSWSFFPFGAEHQFCENCLENPPADSKVAPQRHSREWFACHLKIQSQRSALQSKTNFPEIIENRWGSHLHNAFLRRMLQRLAEAPNWQNEMLDK